MKKNNPCIWAFVLVFCLLALLAGCTSSKTADQPKLATPGTAAAELEKSCSVPAQGIEDTDPEVVGGSTIVYDQDMQVIRELQAPAVDWDKVRALAGKPLLPPRSKSVSHSQWFKSVVKPVIMAELGTTALTGSSLQEVTQFYTSNGFQQVAVGTFVTGDLGGSFWYAAALRHNVCTGKLLVMMGQGIYLAKHKEILKEASAAKP